LESDFIVRSQIGGEYALETGIFGFATPWGRGKLCPISKKWEKKKKMGCPISKKSMKSDFRSGGNMGLKPRYSDAWRLGDAENIEPFQKKWVEKGKSGMSDLKKISEK